MPHQERAKIPILLTAAQQRSKVISAPNPLLPTANVISIPNRRCILQPSPHHLGSCSSHAHSPVQKYVLKKLPQGLLEESEEDGLCGVWFDFFFFPNQTSFISDKYLDIMQPSVAALAFSSVPFQLDPSIPSDTFLLHLEISFWSIEDNSLFRAPGPDCQWCISAVLQ